MNVLARNNVHVLGDGQQAMILAHGYGCDQNMWRFVAPVFARRYRVILFDYVGAGQSDLRAYDPGRYGSLAGYARDVLEICRELRLTRALFVGHSMSAMVGALASIAEPDRFSRLVMVCPSPCFVDDSPYVGGFSRQQIEELLAFLDENHLGWAQALAPLIMGRPDRPDLEVELANSFCQIAPDIARRWARVCFLCDCRADLPRVPTRTLVLQAREDAIAPPAVGAYVHESLPDSELVVLRAAGHCPHLSAPDEVNAAIQGFVAREQPS